MSEVWTAGGDILDIDRQRRRLPAGPRTHKGGRLPGDQRSLVGQSCVQGRSERGRVVISKNSTKQLAKQGNPYLEM